MQTKPYLKSIAIHKPENLGRQFPFSIPAIRAIDTLEFDQHITFLVGENGSGKSTLLESIARIMNFGAQGGTGNFSMEDAAGSSGLHNYMTAKKSYQKPKDRYFLRAESFYNVATYLEDLVKDPDACTTYAQVFARYGGKSSHERSHGESFMSLMVHSFGGKGLYILDEPEAALSPIRQMSALVRIHDLIADDSQFIIATHSPILMAYPGALIYMLDEKGYQQVKYEETEHYQITRDFLNNYPKRLTNLFSDDTPNVDKELD